MLNLQNRLRGGGILAAAGLAAALLVGSIEPSNAGLFSWMKGGQGNTNDGNSGGYNGNRDSGGSSGGGLFGGGQRQPQQPGSRAFHGDELPPEEGNAATQAWITNPALGTPTLSSANIAATKAAIQRYQGIVAQGGWPMVPATVMKPGSNGQAIAILQRRLEISGDLVGRSVPGEYDAAVVAAVKKFQTRHGLPPTGVIDNRATIDALNVPAVVRLAQLQASLKRLQALAPSAPARYVVVNIPAAQVEAVESGQVAQRHAAVVGKPERPSPELSSKIQEINFNPYWYVPKSIIYKDLVPKAREFTRRGQDFLAAYRMQAFDAAGNPIDGRQINWNGTEVYNYQFRQLPWTENSLGYHQDQFPEQGLLSICTTRRSRACSAGRSASTAPAACACTTSTRLTAWILRDSPGWDISRIRSMKQTGEQIDVKLSKPIPVYFAYISAWGLPDGSVQFRPDIYNQDGGAATASAY